MFTILMTGLSGAGKSTLATALQAELSAMAIRSAVLDGDAYRKTINSDLGFSPADRKENIYRLVKLARDMNNQGIISIIAAINPFEEQRKELAQQFCAKIIWVRCDLEMLIKRDTKGLYRKALLPDGHPAKLWNLTGINDTYENPEHPDLIINTTREPIATSLQQLLEYVLSLMDAGIRNCI